MNKIPLWGHPGVCKTAVRAPYTKTLYLPMTDEEASFLDALHRYDWEEIRRVLAGARRQHQIEALHYLAEGLGLSEGSKAQLKTDVKKATRSWLRRR